VLLVCDFFLVILARCDVFRAGGQKKLVIYSTRWVDGGLSGRQAAAFYVAAATKTNLTSDYKTRSRLFRVMTKQYHKRYLVSAAGCHHVRVFHSFFIYMGMCLTLGSVVNLVVIPGF
jgi:hypothetical protein